MLNKLAASIGIGAAKVDAILNTPDVQQGGTVAGTIKIIGGKAEQHIDAVDIHLMTTVKTEVDDRPVYSSFPIEKFSVPLNETVGNGDLIEFPFEFELHKEAPITTLNIHNNKCQVWLQTSLDIDNAIDPTDKDLINVYPCDTVAKILDFVAMNGGNMIKADVEKGILNGGHFQSTSGFYQELEYKINGRETELSFVMDGGVVHCLVEKDRFFGGDSYSSFSLPVGASEHQIQEEVSKHILEAL